MARFPVEGEAHGSREPRKSTHLPTAVIHAISFRVKTIHQFRGYSLHS